MKKFLLFGGLLGAFLLAPQVFSSTLIPSSIVKKGMISKVKAKIYRNEKRGNMANVMIWNAVLDGLNGKDTIFAWAVALDNSNSVKNAKARKFWGKLASTLEKIYDFQLSEHDYDFDSELVSILIDRLNSTSGNEKEMWRSVLNELAGKTSEVGGSVMALRHYVDNDPSAEDPPERWGELIDALEAYTLEQHDETSFTASVTPVNAYEYEISDADTGVQIGFVDGDMEVVEGERVGRVIAGAYGTTSGRTSWEVKFASGAERDRNYLSYGYWSRSRVPAGRENDNYNERKTAVFYNGDNPAGSVDTVRGIAQYNGSTVGVVRENTSESAEIDSFTGDVTLTVDFERDNIHGHVDNISDSRLSRIDLGSANFGSDGSFSGEIDSGPGVSNGEWNGQFYNQGSSTDAPDHVGGSYSFRTGVRKDDLVVEGAFGASETIHVDNFRPSE